MNRNDWHIDLTIFISSIHVILFLPSIFYLHHYEDIEENFTVTATTIMMNNNNESLSSSSLLLIVITIFKKHLFD